MLTIIFEVTEGNEIIALIPESGEVCQKKLSQEDADFYRRQLDEEIMIRTYFNKIPGEIIGRYIPENPFLTNTYKSFRFIPSTNSFSI